MAAVSTRVSEFEWEMTTNLKDTAPISNHHLGVDRGGHDVATLATLLENCWGLHVRVASNSNRDGYGRLDELLPRMAPKR